MTIKGKAGFLTVDEYFSAQPRELIRGLEQLRQTIKKAAPEAEEVISYQMPAFKFHGMLVFYAAYKSHYGLYVLPNVLKAFKDRLTSYETSKATIQFPLDKPLPLKLVAEIVKYGVKENLDKARLKELKKSGGSRSEKNSKR